jgi:hypothetical protein
MKILKYITQVSLLFIAVLMNLVFVSFACGISNIHSVPTATEKKRWSKRERIELWRQLSENCNQTLNSNGALLFIYSEIYYYGGVFSLRRRRRLAAAAMARESIVTVGFKVKSDYKKWKMTNEIENFPRSFLASDGCSRTFPPICTAGLKHLTLKSALAIPMWWTQKELSIAAMQ